MEEVKRDEGKQKDVTKKDRSFVVSGQWTIPFFSTFVRIYSELYIIQNDHQ